MDKRQSNIIIVVCLIISAASVFYIIRARNVEPRVQGPSYPLPLVEAKPQGSTVISPDGKWTLTMKEEKGEGGISHRFITTSTADGTQREIFSKTVAETDVLSIPANTFSPDDKYVFLKETDTAGTSYFVLAVSGAPIAQDAQALDFSSLFVAKHENYKITDATGWGGMNLIVFNTDKTTGGQGPSFWFDVPSHAIIQLSNRFN